jgi:hypothetical protein
MLVRLVVGRGVASYSLVMLQFSQRQSAVLDELVEWWGDISDRKIGSQAVFLAVPPGWGRTTSSRAW